ncbi:MAG: hypothetical protein HYR94_13380 [Chloroflexi bacterium]|nr:hypothetical protein [Chloroflexota bacterium]
MRSAYFVYSFGNKAISHAIRNTHYAASLILISLTFLSCTLAPIPAPRLPDRLYVFDISNLHLNHYEYCITLTGDPSPCPTDGPPPSGKSYGDLLRDYDTLIFVATLQGVVNRDRPRLYLNHDHQRRETPGVDAFWLAKYREAGQPYGWLAATKIIKLASLDELLETFADDLDGIVLWDPAVPATLNVATTIAGVENLAVLRAGSAIETEVTARLPIRESLVGLFKPGAATLPNSATPSTGSPKTDAYLWAKERYLDTGRANPRFLAYLEDGWPATRYAQNQMTRGGVYALERDYVVQQRGFAFDLSPWADETPNDDPTQPLGADAATLKTIVEAAEAQAGGQLIKIWGFIPWYEKYAAEPGVGSTQHTPIKGEWESTWLFSQHGAYLQGGGGDVFGLAMANVSVHKFGPRPTLRTPPSPPSTADLIKKGYLTTNGQVAAGHTFVLFYMGDYDIAHPVEALLANYAASPWLDSRRGEIPLAWGLNPALVEDIPGIMTYLYATQSDRDHFVAANSGAGYLNPDALPEVGLLRWLGRSHEFYRKYGYDIQGFLLNGNGAAMSQLRLDAFTFLTPVGILTPDYEIDEPWPRLQLGTPLSALATETLTGTPDVAAKAVHNAYRRVVLEQGRPPFLAFRSSFQSATFLWGVRDRMQAQDAAGQILGSRGEVLHPNYTVVDPYTFFVLLRRWLE